MCRLIKTQAAAGLAAQMTESRPDSRLRGNDERDFSLSTATKPASIRFNNGITNETTCKITNNDTNDSQCVARCIIFSIFAATKYEIEMKKRNYKTDFLFAKSSFVIGMGSLMGVFSEYYTFNTSESEEEADQMAMESDFAVAGKDLYSALNSL